MIKKMSIGDMRPIVHIGYPKAASTTLQRGLFDKHPGILHVGRATRPGSEIQLILSMIFDDPQFFNEDACKDLIYKIKCEAGDAGLVPVFSHEYFVRGTMRSFAAERLGRLLPDAKILVVLRNQLSFVPSFYAASGRYLPNDTTPKPYNRRYVRFDDWFECALNNRKTSIVGAIDFNATLNLYEKYFAPEDIVCVLFEDLIRNPIVVAEKIANAANLDPSVIFRFLETSHENNRISSRIANYHRIREWLLPSFEFSTLFPSTAAVVKPLTHFLSKGSSYNFELPPYAREILIEHYKDGNRLLKERYGLALEDHGYPIS